MSHTRQQFVDVNITGTLTLLEAAVVADVRCFVYTSTTSVYGDTLEPAPRGPAVWITEESIPSCKNIYGVTKLAAEDMCQLFHRNHPPLSCVVLRTSRFFPEGDDVPSDYADGNDKANEYLYRRAELQDIVDAHLLAADSSRSGVAVDRAFRKYIISATTPFTPADVVELRTDALGVVMRYHPDMAEVYGRLQWKMYPSFGRVYDNRRAREELGWRPKYDFGFVLSELRRQLDEHSVAGGSGDVGGEITIRSPMAEVVGMKMYHRDE